MLEIVKLIFLCALGLVVSSAAQQAETGAPITRTTSSVDIQLCIFSGEILATQRAEFQAVLLSHLQKNILSNTAVYLERQYTTLSGGDLCYLYVYQAPTPEYSGYAVRQLAGLNEQVLEVPFKIPSTGVTVTIHCKVDAAQWSGDDLRYMGAPIPFMWKVNDLLLWGSSLLSVLFVCMSGLCCYALCTRLGSANNTQEDNQILKVDKEILATLLSSKRKANPLTKKMTLPEGSKPKA
jgi:hypothetical protein